MNQKAKTNRRRRRRLGPLQKFITILLTAIAVAFGLMIFFKVGHITVQGNSRYSADEIIEASGVSLGDNLIMVNKSRAANLIMGQLVYITEVKLLRQLPDTLLIKVTESGAAAVVTDTDGVAWCIDRSGKVLKQAEDNEQGIVVTGFTPLPAQAGETLKAYEEAKDGSESDDEDSEEAQANKKAQEKLDQLLTLLAALDKNGILADVSAIDLSEDYNPVLTYDANFKVELGVIDDIDYKLRYLIAVRKKLTDNQSGTIDLTFNADKVAHFRPN